MRLHHVQISMPRGAEAEARRFYGDALGMQETEKPPSLADRGGCWFRAFEGDTVVAEIHLGVDDPFVPAKKAHPGLVCASVEELQQIAGRIEDAGFELSWAERDTFEGYVRFHARDGFGNRIEVMTATDHRS
ncbi:MAG: VOC family protein [Agrococcus casei]|uniref:VOC family protein n=1 Tax=Agrococcus casei TaxID=343512 RepID=UPI003F9093D6